MNQFEPAPAAPPTGNRFFFMLAAAGAGFAALYWAALTALTAVGVAAGAGNAAQVIVPCVLIALYAYRGFQLLRGDVAAARRLMLLHVVGSIVTVVQIVMGHGDGIMVVLQGIKVAINVFGGIAAFLAVRSVSTAPAGYRP